MMYLFRHLRRFLRPLAAALPARVLLTVLGLMLLAVGGIRADTTYQIQPILQPGGMAGDVPIPSTFTFFLGPLNDAGQLLIDAGGSNGDILLQYSGGKLIPILVAGREGPDGVWPEDVGVRGPGHQSMNQRGNVVFDAESRSTGLKDTYFWDAQSQKATSVVRPDLPAVDNLTFTEFWGNFPELNNRDEVALHAFVSDPTGLSGPGLFLIGPEPRVVPVLLPGQELPGGGKQYANPFHFPSLNDAGQVTFLALRQGEKQFSAYLWDAGAITPLVRVGDPVPGGGKVSSVGYVLLNNQNRTAVAAVGIGGSRRHGLYRVAAGQLIPLATPGQEMPGGGKFSTLQLVDTGPPGPLGAAFACFGVSAANEAGEHAFVATLEGGATAAYKVGIDGALSLILKSGTSTDLGLITKVGGTNPPGLNLGGTSPPSLNRRGQVALVVKVAGGRDTVVLLTPAVP